MGLDMYAYAAVKRGEMDEYYENYNYDKDSSTISKPREIAYWRKHPNLHGWMRRLWIEKGHAGDFNGDELELTWEDLDQLEKDVQSGNLPSTTGFFFGNESDDFYKDADLAFIKNARAELFGGLKVFYNSSW